MIKGRYEARFSAVGGQGVLLAGDILALAAQKYEGRFSVQSPTYTAQVRGGPTKIDVIIDDEPVVYPKTTAIDFFLSMAQGSYDAFFYDIKDNATVVIDPNLVTKWNENYLTYRVPIIEMTKAQIGKMVMSSVLSLGIMVELTGIVSKEAVEKALMDKAPRGTEELNLKAINIGFEQAKILKAGK